MRPPGGGGATAVWAVRCRTVALPPSPTPAPITPRTRHGCSGHPNCRAAGAVRGPRTTRRTSALVLGRTATGGRAHLLDRHHPPRWPPALSTRVGGVAGRRLLVQHRL